MELDPITFGKCQLLTKYEMDTQNHFDIESFSKFVVVSIIYAKNISSYIQFKQYKISFVISNEQFGNRNLSEPNIFSYSSRGWPSFCGNKSP